LSRRGEEFTITAIVFLWKGSSGEPTFRLEISLDKVNSQGYLSVNEKVIG
jgi:hypothetical protein